jgi:hypothetical protein
MDDWSSAMTDQGNEGVIASTWGLGADELLAAAAGSVGAVLLSWLWRRKRTSIAADDASVAPTSSPSNVDVVEVRTDLRWHETPAGRSGIDAGIEAAATADSIADRAFLVGFCVELEDLLERPALKEKVGRALARVGVLRIDPSGEVFDPDHHCAVGTQPTGEPSRHDVVASVERFGYRDGDRVLQVPDVTVWRYDASFEGGSR